MTDHIILVDEQDNQIGTGEKLAVHKAGKLHRCFSIFVFNSKGELLLQQRALTKYHSGGLWTNTCCGHPSPGEDTEAAAHRRLREEMGFDCQLKEAFTFVYEAELDNDITEREYDHAFIGIFDGVPQLNPEEAQDWKWVGLDWLQQELATHPERYTAWLKICFDQLLESSKTVGRR